MSKKKTRHLLIAKIGEYDRTKYLGINTQTGKRSWSTSVAEVLETLEETREGEYNGSTAQPIHWAWVKGKSCLGLKYSKVVMG